MEKCNFRNPSGKSLRTYSLPHIYKRYARGPELLSQILPDGAKVYSPIKAENDRIRLQVGVNNAEEWAKIWNMFFHARKCKHLHVGNHYPTKHYTMSLDQNQITIEQVASEKDLGVIFDEKLLSREHIVKKKKSHLQTEIWEWFLKVLHALTEKCSWICISPLYGHI